MTVQAQSRDRGATWSCGTCCALTHMLGCLAVTAALLLAVPLTTRAATFHVDAVTDAPDIVPGDGQCVTDAGNCTLRAAIQEANALDGADEIDLPPGTYVLASSAAGEDAALTGDLDITADLTITGSASGSSIISGSLSDRVLDVLAGAHVTLSTLTIQNGRLPSGDGGGIRNAGDLTVMAVSLRNNLAAAGDGGGIANLGGATLLLTNVTISANEATVQRGGGIANLPGGAVHLNNVTLSDNTANRGGGLDNLGVATLHNTIVAAERAGGTCGGAAVTSLGHNLDASGLCLFTVLGDDISNKDPKLGPLVNTNGGTTYTQALLTGSPAIDAGDDVDCPPTDQRGAQRPTDGNHDGIAHCDIGAFESLGALPPTATASPSASATISTPTPTDTRIPLDTPTPTASPSATLAPSAAAIALGVVPGHPGERVMFEVRLLTVGATVTGVQNVIDFVSAHTPIAMLENAAPYCTVNAQLGKQAVFQFQPPVCLGAACTQVAAAVLSVFGADSPIADGVVLYTCQVDIAAAAIPGTYPLHVSGVVLTGPGGTPLPDASGIDGAIVVLAFAATASPTSTATATPPASPTATPSTSPTGVPTSTPTEMPTSPPSASPTHTGQATATQTASAGVTNIPTQTETPLPSHSPTVSDTAAPSVTFTPSQTPSSTSSYTATPTATPVPTDTETATPTATTTLTSTRVPTPTPTLTPRPCAGDCSRNSVVSGDELLGLVQIALGELSARVCPAGDVNRDNTVTVDEVLAAVNSASVGCPPN